VPKLVKVQSMIQHFHKKKNNNNKAILTAE